MHINHSVLKNQRLSPPYFFHLVSECDWFHRRWTMELYITLFFQYRGCAHCLILDKMGTISSVKTVTKTSKQKLFLFDVRVEFLHQFFVFFLLAVFRVGYNSYLNPYRYQEFSIGTKRFLFFIPNTLKSPKDHRDDLLQFPSKQN